MGATGKKEKGQNKNATINSPLPPPDRKRKYGYSVNEQGYGVTEAFIKRKYISNRE